MVIDRKAVFKPVKTNLDEIQFHSCYAIFWETHSQKTDQWPGCTWPHACTSEGKDSHGTFGKNLYQGGINKSKSL